MERTPRPAKVATVDEIRVKLAASSAALLTEYRGLTVKNLAELRAALRPSGAQYKVYKNTLARRAATEAGQEGLVDLLVGPTAITFVTGDPVEAARALREFAKGSPAFSVKGGLLGGRVLSARDVNALADIEPRHVLLAKIAGAMQAPMVKAAGLFQAFPRNMAYGIKALIEKRIAAGEALPAAGDPAPVDSELASAAAEAAAPAADSELASVAAETAPVDSEAAPVDNEAAPAADSEAAPADGEAAPAADSDPAPA